MVSVNEITDPDLNLNDGWSLGEKAFLEIENRLKILNPKRILEFGSGKSSIRLALSFPECEISTVEHDLFFADKTKALKSKFGILNALFFYAPLKYQWFGSNRYLTYSFSPSYVEFDSIIIDGPPGSIRGGREACLYLAYENLKVGGYVFLDDYQRSAEQKAVRNWLKTYPGSFEWSVIESRHRIAVLKKVRQVNPRKFAVTKLIHSLRYALSNLISDLRGLVKHG